MVVYRENEKENGSYYLVCRGNGEENVNYPKGNCCNISIYRDNGKKNGNYCLRFMDLGLRLTSWHLGNGWWKPKWKLQYYRNYVEVWV